MNNVLRRCAAAVLSIGVATPAGAAERLIYRFDTCVAQRECRVVSRLELDRLRGGFSLTTAAGTVQFTFGIAQAVFVNDQLVAMTQIVSQLGDTIAMLAPNGIPAETLVAALRTASGAVGSSTNAVASSTKGAAGAATQGAQAVQPAIQTVPGAAAQSTPALQPTILAATGAVTQAGQAASAATGSAPSAATNATQSVQSGAPSASTAASNATQGVSAGVQAPAASQTATASQVAAANPPASGAASGTTANAASSPPPVLVNGTPVIPGQPVVNIVNVPSAAELRSLVVQVGTGNTATTIGNGALAIQNTVDGAAIRAATVLEVSAKLKDALSSMRLQNSIRSSLSLPY